MTGLARAARRPRAWLSWSSGKDAAYALHALRHSGTVEVVGLLTTVTSAFGRVSMHGVREALLDAQADALGLPLEKVRIPYPCPNETYEAAMRATLERARAVGVETVAFGDLFLEEIRGYRERRLSEIGFHAVFPLWGRPTAALAEEMIDRGVRARVSCLDPRRLPPRFAGSTFDRAFLRAIPPEVDPCGERGEFHTFVTDAPGFRHPLRVDVGASVERDGFLFTDLVPSAPPESGD